MASDDKKYLPDLVTPADVADALDVTTGHVRHLARTGRLPGIYLDRFMAARRVEPPKPRKVAPDRILAGLGLGRGGRTRNG